MFPIATKLLGKKSNKGLIKYNNLKTKQNLTNKQNIQKRNLQIATQGGRSSVSGLIVTVFGCTGFLGRYVVEKFGRIGSQLVIPYRSGDYDYAHLKVMGDVGQIIPLKWHLKDLDSIYNAVKHSNVVVNLVGREWETRNFSFEDVHIKGARDIARICKEAEVERFVHVSTAGYNPNSDCKWLRTKSQGEDAVKEVFEGATIIRPTHLFGAEDRLTNSHAQMMRYWKIFPLLNANRKIQPVFSDDVAEVIMAAISRHDSIGKTIEVGGPTVYTIEQFDALIAKVLEVEPIILREPKFLIGLFAKFSQYHRNPRFTPDSIKDVEDRVVSDNAIKIDSLGLDETKLTAVEDKLYGLIRRYKVPNIQQHYIELPRGFKKGN